MECELVKWDFENLGSRSTHMAWHKFPHLGLYLTALLRNNTYTVDLAVRLKRDQMGKLPWNAIGHFERISAFLKHVIMFAFYERK